jgi:hypothetical protein
MNHQRMIDVQEDIEEIGAKIGLILAKILVVAAKVSQDAAPVAQVVGAATGQPEVVAGARIAEHIAPVLEEIATKIATSAAAQSDSIEPQIE